MNELNELAKKLDYVEVLIEDNEKTKQDITKIHGAIQILNKEVRQVRQEGQAENLRLFMGNINNRVDNTMSKVMNFFVDVKKRVFPMEITPEMMKELIARTGTKQKELADILGYNLDDLSAVSRVINGEIKDQYKRWLVYNYCNQKMKDIIKTDKSEVTI